MSAIHNSVITITNMGELAATLIYITMVNHQDCTLFPSPETMYKNEYLHQMLYSLDQVVTFEKTLFER